MKKLVPILWTKKLEETASFYEKELGFTSRGNSSNFVSLSKGDVEIMFMIPDNEHVTESSFTNPVLTGSLYIWIDNIEVFWNVINDKSGNNKITITTTLAKREYNARDFSILDNNGYELVFGEDINRD